MLLRLAISFLCLLSACARAQEAPVPPGDTPKVELLKPIQPKYPPAAVEARLQAQVVIRLFVNQEGKVVATKLISGHPMLAPTAIDAANRARFKPFLYEGQPASFETKVVINFTLERPDHPVVSVKEPGPVEVNSEKLYSMHSERPTYPKEVTDHRAAQVTVRFTVDEAGKVIDAQAIDGEEAFRLSAEAAVRKWTFAPYLQDGKPCRLTTNLTVDFNGAEPSESGSSRVHVSRKVLQGFLLHRVTPEYPTAAKIMKHQGAVHISLVIGTDGKVRDLKADGPEEFRESALNAVRQWEYKPYLLNGRPVEVESEVVVFFSL